METTKKCWIKYPKLDIVIILFSFLCFSVSPPLRLSVSLSPLLSVSLSLVFACSLSLSASILSIIFFIYVLEIFPYSSSVFCCYYYFYRSLLAPIFSLENLVFAVHILFLFDRVELIKSWITASTKMPCYKLLDDDDDDRKVKEI